MSRLNRRRERAVGPAAFLALISSIITVSAAFMPWIENRVGTQSAFALQPSALFGGPLSVQVSGVSLGVLLLVCSIGLLAAAFSMGTKAGVLLAVTCMFGQAAISLAWVYRFSESDLGNIVGPGAWAGLLAAAVALLSAVVAWTGFGIRLPTGLSIRR